jgi:hypothetical protein
MKHEINERVIRALPHTFFDYSKGKPPESMNNENFQVFCQGAYGGDEGAWFISPWENGEFSIEEDGDYIVYFWTYLQNPMKGR